MKKNIFYILLGLTSIVILAPFIESFLDKVIELTKMNQVISSYVLDTLFILTFMFYITIIVVKYKNLSISRIKENFKSYLLILFMLGFYVYERCFNHHYYFEPLKSFKLFTYFDVFFTGIISYFLLSILQSYKRTSDKEKENSLESDSPIKNSEEDELDGLFSKTVSKIKSIIKENSFDNSFTIGLNSEWGGMGKHRY